jgi:hypothetical protein
MPEIPIWVPMYILESFGMENVGIIFGRLEYYTAFWYILMPFGTFCGHFEYFFPFWYVVPRKIWQPRLYAERIFFQSLSRNPAVVVTH